MSETDLIKNRYDKRRHSIHTDLYSFLRPDVYMTQQEKERALIAWLRDIGWQSLSDKRVLEIGCGSGFNLLSLMRLGFSPNNLVGNELLPERYQAARYALPACTELLLGDACDIDLPPASFDVVFQSTVFTSILDDSFQTRLADRIWELVKPGGGILWYDFTFNNPNNPDVRGIKARKIKELFPSGTHSMQRITLAPPLSRRVCRIHPTMYHIFNAFPFLRTHVLCWIEK